jgi:hypothetical protein
VTAEAEVLLNPRPSGVVGNEMNFPSKLLHYLTALKPVATTLTPGVAPEYRGVVIAAEVDSPAAFAVAIDPALPLSDVEIGELARRIQVFLADCRLWLQQAVRFLGWSATLQIASRLAVPCRSIRTAALLVCVAGTLPARVIPQSIGTASCENLIDER